MLWNKNKKWKYNFYFKYFEIQVNKNENTIYQILWDRRIIVLSKKYIALNTYIWKKKDLKINNLNSHLREPEIEEQMKPKAIRRIKIWAEINSIENKISSREKSTKSEAGSLKSSVESINLQPNQEKRGERRFIILILEIKKKDTL